MIISVIAHDREPRGRPTFCSTPQAMSCGFDRLEMHIELGKVPVTASDWQMGCSGHPREKLVCIVGRFVKPTSSFLHADIESAARLIADTREGRLGDLCRELTGEFVLMVWDGQSRVLRVLTDPVSSIPIYYTQTHSGALYLGNHLGRLAREAYGTIALDPDVARTIIFGVPSELGATCARNIRFLPGGSELSFSDDIARCRRYWQMAPISSLSESELVERYRECVYNRMQAFLKHEQKVAVALSGGLDSSSLLAVGHRVAPGKLIAITKRVPNDDASNEFDYANTAVAGTGIPLHVDTFVEHACSKEVLREVCQPETLAWIPFFPTIAKLAREQGCTALIVGAYGDTVNGFSGGWQKQLIKSGEYRALYSTLREHRRPNSPSTVRQFFSVWARTRMPPLFDLWDMSRKVKELCTPERAQMFAQHAHFTVDSARRILSNERQWSEPDAPLQFAIRNHLDRLGVETQHLGRLVESMFGVKMLYPFADPEFFRIAASLPWSLRFGAEGGRMLLRRAMAGILPEKIRLRRTKCQFSALYVPYFKRSLETREFIEGGKQLENVIGQPWERIRTAGLSEREYVRVLPSFRIGMIGAWLQAQQSAS